MQFAFNTEDDGSGSYGTGRSYEGVSAHAGVIVVIGMCLRNPEERREKNSNRMSAIRGLDLVRGYNENE
jgi:hypothetical protein